MFNLTSTHQSIVFVILLLLVVFFIKWLFSPTSKQKNNIVLPPIKIPTPSLEDAPPVFEVQFHCSSFLKPSEILTESNQVGIEYELMNGRSVTLLFNVPDIQKVFNKIKEHNGNILEYTFYSYLEYSPGVTYYHINFKTTEAEDAWISKPGQTISFFENPAMENYAEHLSQL